MFVSVAGRRCVVVGGGGVAARKARGLLEHGAAVVVVSPEIRSELETTDAEILRRPYESGDLEGAFLAFAATDSRGVNAAVTLEARERGIPVNVADRPTEGDFASPATLRRGGLQVAVSTGGASPTLARRIKEELEPAFAPEWAGIVEKFGVARKNGEAPEGELEGEVVRCLSRLRG